jgi:hypothetical protein
MTGRLDQSVENLRMLCELLRVTNPLLETGAAELAAAAHTVAEGESRLSSELDHLVTEVDAVQKQAETSQAEAVNALTELAHAAEGANTEALTEIETDAAAVQAHWTSVLHEKGSSLDSAFGELKSHGWDPLVATLGNEQGDFEKWEHAADEALQDLVHAVEGVVEGVTHSGSLCEEAAKGLEAAPPLTEDYWQGTERDAKKIVEETIPEFGGSVERHGAELSEVYEQVMAAIDAGNSHLRAQLDLTTETAVSAIDAQAEAMGKAVETADEALRSVQSRYELSAVHGEEAGREATELLELAGHVVDAQAQLAKVREVLEVLGQ